MMIVLTVLLGLWATALLLPAVSDLMCVIRLALWPKRTRVSATGHPRLLVFIPAHNEELLLEPCVHSLCSQRYPSSHLSVVVIADNCTDATATVARSAGAVCLERTDLERKGKPRAIAWALDQIDYRSYDAVIIIDADTVVDPSFADHIARVPDLRNKAVQPYNGIRNPGDSALTRMGAVFTTIRYALAISPEISGWSQLAAHGKRHVRRHRCVGGAGLDRVFHLRGLGGLRSADRAWRPHRSLS